MKFFLLVFDILFAFDEPSSVFPARISNIRFLRVVVAFLKPSGDGALTLLEQEEEEEEETARALVASCDESENEEDEGAINARIVCICMYVYIICA